MRTLLRLVLAHARRHRLRVALTIAAIAIASAGVALNLRTLARGHRNVERISRNMGRFHAILVPETMGGKDLDSALVADLVRDPRIADVDAAVALGRVRVLEPIVSGRGPFRGASVIGTDADLPPQDLETGAWLPGAPDSTRAVISSTFRERSGLDLDDRVVLVAEGGVLELTVSGVVAVETPPPGKAAARPPHLADLWIRREPARRLGNRPDRSNLVAVTLRGDSAIDGFVAEWSPRAAAAHPVARLRSVRDEAMNMFGRESSEMGRMLLAASTFLWTLAIGFTVFLSLSIGTRTRLRQYAILRALGMTRRQVAILVASEASSLGLLGWALGAAGVRLAVGPAATGATATIVSLGCVLAGVMAATLPSLWLGTRIAPADILAGRGRPRGGRAPRWMAVTGLILIVFNPTIIMLGRFEAVRTFLSWMQVSRVGFGAPLAGSVFMIVGFGLCTPWLVCLTERLFGPASARLLRLDARLLRQQQSENIWRTTGTTVAQATGLTLFITSLVWGFSMLVPFMPTEGLPRIQVSMGPHGIPDEAVPALARIPGVKRRGLLPSAVEHPRLTAATLARPGFATVDPDQQHVIVMGLDPEDAFGGEDPPFDLEFLEGDAAGAIAALTEGRGCIIPDHFARQCDLGLGDTFAVEVPDGEGKEVEYTVAAIADVPGWNWLTKMSGVRTRAVRALAMIFVDRARARADFDLSRVKHVWLEIDEPALLAVAGHPGSRPRGGRGGGRAGPAGGPGGNPFSSPAGRALETAIRDVVVRHLPRDAVAGVANPAALAIVSVTDRDGVQAMLTRRANSVIRSLTLVPLIMLVITTLAVVNAILASVRSRSWQFGILRGIGLTRGQLVRIVLGESFRIWFAASVLGLVSGIALGWCGTRLCSLFFFFAGRTPPLVFPWGGIGLGIAIALVLCLLAGLIPAIATGRREPMHFIQRGRQSA